MAARDLAIKLTINADTAEGKAALQAFAQEMGKLPGEANTAAGGLKSSFHQIREDINAAFTFSAGQLIADSLKSGIAAVKQFGQDAVAEFLAFEQVMVGVAKTTGLPKEEVDKLGDSLRDIAADIGPILATDIGQIAVVAGQLGIATDKIEVGKWEEAREEIEGFAMVIAKAAIALPEFGGGAEQVATVIAKQIALYQENTGAAEQFLSVMNELANTTSANAAQIASFLEGFTIAPQLKITQDQAAALGATFISLGQDANDAATRLQSAFAQVLKGTDKTDAALEAILHTSQTAFDAIVEMAGGMQQNAKGVDDLAATFRKALGQDAVSATIALVDALGTIDDPAQRMELAFAAFGQVGARTLNTLIGNTDSLKANLDRAAQAAQDNISIQREFEVAISTQGAKFEELKSKISDIKIEVGQHLVGALAKVTETDINPAIDQFRTWLKTSEEARTFFESTLPTAISGVSGALMSVAQAGVSATNTIAKIGSDVGTFIGDLQTGQTTLGEVGAALGEMLGLSGETAQQLGDFAQGAADAFSEFFEGVASGKISINEIGDALAQSVGLSQEHAQQVGAFAQSVSDGIGELYDGLSSGTITLREVGQAVGDMVGLSEERLSAMKGFAADAITGFKDLYSGIADGTITFADIAAAGNEFFDGLTTQFGLDAAYDAFTAQLSKLKAGWADWKANSESYTTAFFDGVTESFGLVAAYDAMQSGLGKLKAAWGLDWSEWTAAPKAAFLGLWEDTTAAGAAAFADLKSSVASALSGMGDAIAQPFRDGAAQTLNAFLGLGEKIGREFDTAKQKALDFYAATTKSETLTGLFEKVTDKIMGVPPAIDEATAAQNALTVSVRETTAAIEEEGDVAYARSVYPDMTKAIGITTATNDELTQSIQRSTEQIKSLEGAYRQTGSAIKEKQNAVRDLDIQIRNQEASLRNASKTERAEIRSSIIALQNKRSEIQNSISVLQQQASVQGQVLKEEKRLLKESESAYKERIKSQAASAKEQEKLNAEYERAQTFLAAHNAETIKANQQLQTYQNYLNDVYNTTGSQVIPKTEDYILTLEDLQKQLEDTGEAASVTFGELAALTDGIAKNLGTLSGGIGKLGDILGVKELGGLGSVLGQVQQFAMLPGILNEVGGALSGLMSGLGGLGGMLPQISGLLGNLGGVFGGIGGAVGGLLPSLGGLLPMLGPIGLAGGAIALAWGPLKDMFSSIFGEAQSQGNAAAETMRNFVAANIEGGAEMSAAMSTAYDQMKAAGFDYQTFLAQTGTTMDQVFGGISQNWQEGSTALDLFTQSLVAAGVPMEKAPQVALQMMASFQEMGLSAEEAAAKMLEIAEAAGMSEADIESLRAALQGVSSDLAGSGEEGAATGAVFDQASAKAQDLEAKVTELSGSLGEVAGQLSGAGAEGASTGAVFDQAKGKAQELEGQITTLSGSVSDVTGQLSGAGAEGLATSNVFSTAEAAAQALSGTADALSSSVAELTTQMTSTGVEAIETSNMFGVAGDSAAGLQGDMDGLGSQAAAASLQLDEIRAMLALIPNEKEIKVKVTTEGEIPELAAGGSVGLSGLAIVNERGPELARFPGGSMALLTTPGPVMGAFPVGTEIIPHHRARDILRDYPMIPRMAEGGRIGPLPGGISVSINNLVVQGQMGSPSDLRRMADELSQQIAQRVLAKTRVSR